MLLIYPPLAKPCEPPAGIARLAGALRKHNIHCNVIDANIEAFSYLFKLPLTAADTWSRRAIRDLQSNIAAISSPEIYSHPDRYRRALFDINKIVEMTGSPALHLTLANYQDLQLSPVKSCDLLQAAENFKQNIFYPYFSKRLDSFIKEQNPSFIGISINYLSQANCGMALCGFLKQQYPQISIILGGGLITSWLQNPEWNNPFKGLSDYLVAGPGEKKLLKILGPRNNTISKKPITTAEIGTPDYSDMPINDYMAPGFILPFAASSGCYWNKCSFCPEKAEENPYIWLPAKRAYDEMKSLILKHKPSLLHLLDNAVSPTIMKAIINKPLGVDWYGFARISQDLTDENFCMQLRQSGCRMLKLGLESGDQDVLDSMQKGIKLPMVVKALKSLKKAGIATYVYLLFGTPSEDKNSAQSTLDFVIEHHDEITFLNLAIFNMPICSAEARNLAVNNFYEADLSLYTDFVHPKGWSRKLIRQFLDQKFKRHPAIASILRRDPPFFTSNHAACFVGQ